MQERAYEEVETLWPYGGFTVRAFERKLGEGKLTLTDSLCFSSPRMAPQSASTSPTSG